MNQIGEVARRLGEEPKDTRKTNIDFISLHILFSFSYNMVVSF